MTFDVVDGLGRNLSVAHGVAGVAGLQETGVGTHDVGIHRRFCLAIVDHLDFIDDGELHLGLATEEEVLRRKGDPVNIGGQSTGAVGLHGDEPVLVMQGVDKTFGELQRWLATGDDHEAGRILYHLGYNLLLTHLGSTLMLGVAERTTQVAAAQPHEDGGGAGMVAFTLQTVEYLVDFHTFLYSGVVKEVKGSYRSLRSLVVKADSTVSGAK